MQGKILFELLVQRLYSPTKTIYTHSFGRCTGITFVDSTMIPVCHNLHHLLKDKGNLVHSRHRSVNNFLMNLIAAISAYCFFDNKTEAINGYCVEDNKQLTLF